MHVPVITIDGPSGSGKGTISQFLAEELRWHHLDSGALYRLLAYAALQDSVALDNAAALTAVLKDIEQQKVDKLICLGDVIGYGADPLECLAMVDRACEIKLMGNHEYAALGCLPTQYYRSDAQKAAAWTQEQLTDRELSIMADFDLEREFNGFRFVHASPFEPDSWHYILGTDQARTAFDNFGEQICFLGHSHLPMIFVEANTNGIRQKVGHDFLPDLEARYLINVGSVGQPRDDDPRACYVVFDIEEYEIVFRRVEYDICSIQERMKQAALPSMLIERLSIGK